MQQTTEPHCLPTIDDFITATREIRGALVADGIEPSSASMRPGLERYAAARRERYLAAATNSFEREQRLREWERAQISGLFSGR
jgi:hypothetical protein